MELYTNQMYNNSEEHCVRKYVMLWNTQAINCLEKTPDQYSVYPVHCTSPLKKHKKKKGSKSDLQMHTI